jgi:hypothetical protein
VPQLTGFQAHYDTPNGSLTTFRSGALGFG